MAKRYKGSNKIKYKNVLIVVLVLILVISGYKIIKWFFNNKENENIQSNLSQYVEINKKENDNENKNDKKDNTYKIDFKALKKINNDTIGWLKVNNTNIEYVVVKGNDNDYYLSHNFEKQNNNAGWIFADYRNKFDYTDYNIVVYGHNRKDDSMFGTLKNTLKEEWYNNDENRHIVLATENGTFKYEVFSIYEEEASDYPIQVGFKSDSEYLKFLNTIKDKSVKDFGIKLSAEKGIITLSTCGDDNKNRVILHAIKEN